MFLRLKNMKQKMLQPSGHIIFDAVYPKKTKNIQSEQYKVKIMSVKETNTNVMNPILMQCLACHPIFLDKHLYFVWCVCIRNSSPIQKPCIQIGESIASSWVAISNACLECNLIRDLCSHRYACIIHPSNFSKGVCLI